MQQPSKYSARQDRVYFINLDIIRFIAAYMIVLFHMFYGWQYNYGFPKIMTDGEGKLKQWGVYLENAIHNFSFGVDIFFLISGFLITYLLLFEKEKTETIDIKKFLMRRVLRIWPLYFLIIATGPLLTYLFDAPGPGSYWPHVFFLGNFEIIQNGMSSASLNHLWSICIEEHFYLVCPFLIAFIPNRFLPFTFMTIIFVSFAYRGMVSGTENYWMKMYVHTFARMDVLAVGCWAGFAFWKGQIKFDQSRAVLVLLSTVFILLFINDVYVFWDSFYLATAKKYIYILIAGVVLGNLLFNKKIKFLPKKKNFLHYLGKVSYGIYMFNPIVVAVFIKMFQRYEYRNGWVYLIGIHLGILLLVVLSFELMEKPILKLKERFQVVKTRKY